MIQTPTRHNQLTMARGQRIVMVCLNDRCGQSYTAFPGPKSGPCPFCGALYVRWRDYPRPTYEDSK